MSPAFRLVVGVLVALPRRRASGLHALGAGVAGALVARALRDGIGRARPGTRSEGGFPSRHAAAATAITASLWTREPRLARTLAVATALGAAARVADAEHEPGDVLAGALVGLAVATALEKSQP